MAAAAASGGKLTASFSLKFEDLVGPEVAKLMKQLKDLGGMMKSLGFAKLRDGVREIQDATRGAGDLTKGIDDVARSARSAGGAVSRLGRDASTDFAKVTREAANAARQLETLRRGGLGSMQGGLFRQGFTPFVPAMPGEMEGTSRMARMGRGMQGAVGRGREFLGGMHNDFGVVEGAAAGIAVMEPARQYAELENTLRHIAITEKLSGPAVEAEVKRLLGNLQREATETGQDTRELAKAYNFLITTGMTAATVDKLMPAHARAATAYNIPSDAMGQAVFALHDSFKIPEQGMPEALAAMAYAAKEGHFTVEAFSHFLPMIGGRMQGLGMTGRHSADTAFAALETVVKNSADPGTAATNFGDFLQYLTAPIAAHSFALQGRGVPEGVKRMILERLPKGATGIDLPGMMIAAEKAGVDPLRALLGKLQQITAGRTPVQTKEILGALLHNQQAADAALSLLQHSGEFERVMKQLEAVNRTTVDTDYDTAHRAPIVGVKTFDENARQIQDRIGLGFVPALEGAGDAMGRLNAWIKATDASSPGMIDKVLLLTAGFLGLVAGLGTLGFVAGPIAAGFRLILAPIQLLSGLLADGIVAVAGMGAASLLVLGPLALLGAAAWDILDNWEEFAPLFQRLFSGDLSASLEIGKKLFGDFASWVDSWTGGFATLLGEGITKALDGATSLIRMIISGWQKLFDDLTINIRVPQVTNANPGSMPGVVDRAQILQERGFGADGMPRPGQPNLVPSEFEFNRLHLHNLDARKLDVQVTVAADAGLNATAKASGEGVQSTTVIRAAPDRGTVLGRP